MANNDVRSGFGEGRFRGQPTHDAEAALLVGGQVREPRRSGESGDALGDAGEASRVRPRGLKLTCSTEKGLWHAAEIGDAVGDAEGVPQMQALEAWDGPTIT